jgi:pimeloyl-ACP methyl ester carboxylesterase
MFTSRFYLKLCMLVCLFCIAILPSSFAAGDVGPAGHTYKITIPKQGVMIADANFYCWVPDNVETLRCIIVHLHGCTREGDAKPMMDDLQWKALAKKWNSVLVAPSFVTGGNSETCSNWYDIRNGSGNTYLEMLDSLALRTGHKEISRIPWALWGHSGGAIWITAMTGKYPERVAAAVAQSGFTDIADNEAARNVPVLHHNGRQDILHNEGQVAKGRKAGALWAYAINPNTVTNMDGHQVHDMRFLAIPWLDACLSSRLPGPGKSKLKDMDTSFAWLGSKTSGIISPDASFQGDKSEASWFPDKNIAEKWVEYMAKGTVTDNTPPPAPYDLTGTFAKNQVTLTWNAEADIESGLQTFIIYRNGSLIQNIRYTNVTKYSSTMGYQRWNDGDQASPSPAPIMTFVDTDVNDSDTYVYEISSVNWSNVIGPKSASFTIKQGQPAEVKSQQ